MKIGIIGCGIVGGACKFGFEKLGHSVIVHDIKLNTDISVVLDTELTFICVPTPMNRDGSCDISIVKSTVDKLCDINYTGTVAIKSTVPPGTTKDIWENIKNKTKFSDLAFVPEFLRERCAISDFVEHQSLLAIGTDNVKTYALVLKAHGDYPKSNIHLSTTQAEILKYYHNTFNALRVVFANEFYELAKFFDEEYTPIKNALLKTTNVPDIYLDVNENMRGYSSICWNKDVPALISLCKQNNIKIPLIEIIPDANDNYKKTPFEGTRE
jgi:UDPglucose 6-dehydrogenase